MKRLLLNSYNIKPVNIRIVSNGVECADLKMLKENFCISDIKNVLDGRLVNWLSNIGEKELADSINEKYSSPDSLNGKEYYLCELFFMNFTLKEYAQTLFREKDDKLFLEEIKRITNLIVEAYNLNQHKYSQEQWLNLFELEFTLYNKNKYSSILDTIKNKIKDEKENIDKEKFGKYNQTEYLTKFFNAVYDNANKNPNGARTEAIRILKRYKGCLNPEYELLVNEFINRYVDDHYWIDKPRIKRKIDNFLKDYQLNNIDYEHN